MAFLPLLKAVLFGGVGFLAGSGLAAGIRSLMGLDPWSAEPMLVLGYLLGLIGWLLGVGLWDAWAREWLGLPTSQGKASGWPRYFRFCTNH